MVGKEKNMLKINKIKKYLLFSLLFIALIAGCGKKDKQNEKIEENKQNEEQIQEKNIEIINPKSNSRPIAIMINNHFQAVPNHAGLQDAYIVYEINVEGGFTRLMALFKDKNTERIGSVRSSRPYFLDYVLENDAIYTHFGYSDQAKNDINTLGINNVNFLIDNGSWRDTSLNVAYEHTAFTNIENILSVATNKGYRLTTEEKTLLNYTTDEVDLSKMDSNMVATNVSVNHSASQNTSYAYDNNLKLYKRFINNNPHTDAITKEQYTVKNIIVIRLEVYSNDGYYQNLNNIGEGDGYYITNGYATPIKWHKSSRESKTTYTYLNGNEINVNDGNTFIQMQPLNEQLVIN